MAKEFSTNHGPSERGGSVVLFSVAIISALLAALLWGLIRAYTGLFDILNLRVLLASFVLTLPLFLMPAFAFSLSGWRRIFVIVIPIMAMIPVGGGECLGMALSGTSAVWQKFNLIWLGLGVGFAVMGCVAVFFKNDLT